MTAGTPYKWVSAASFGAAASLWLSGSDRATVNLWAMAALVTWLMSTALANAGKM